MAFAAWIADVVGFVRDRPRLAAAAAVAFLAMVAPVWWLVPQRGELAPSRALVERSRTAIEVLIGGRIAEQVSWANPRLASLRDGADAMRWQLFRMQESQQAQMSLGCYSTQRLLRNVIAQAQFGESGRLRQELAARGVTTAQAAEARRVARRWQR
ncbi:MAG TPA: hypothetical protein VN325_19460 [Steroidobacteraceae bacterium]|nr:hypothetical protein [Steroidobacteraceae bacterium]